MDVSVIANLSGGKHVTPGEGNRLKRLTRHSTRLPPLVHDLEYGCMDDRRRENGEK